MPFKFRVNWPFGSEEKDKIEFQNGGDLGFQIGMMLVIFDSQMFLILPTKFLVNWFFGSGE